MFPIANSQRGGIMLLVGYSVICLVGPGESRNTIHIMRMELVDTPTIRATGSIDPFGPPPITAINLQATLSKNLSDITINGVFTIRSKFVRLENAFFNQTVDACAFFKQASRSRLLQIIQHELKQHSNLPIACPVTAATYIIRNASFAHARIPAFLPSTHFRVDVNIMHGKPLQVLLATRWFGMLRKVTD